ncbi:hypothetical protein [Flagellimonas sp. GZD32]|uniref:hypothetical protein n=1 Tax=Flagellimonas cixiensis TaxID=3228750 RepID=UPI0035C88325
MDKNLGCKYNPQSAITWFFENEEKGIILEDDCLPSLSFFRYCQELLNRYENDLRVWGISGTNLQPNIQVPYSYYFSNYFMTWGWATWRNRWQQHLKELPNLNLYFNDPVMQNKLPSKIANQRLLNYVKNSFEDKLDAWDYLWIFSCMANNGLLATPSKNMIQNIGFGEDATHTFGNSRNQVTEVEIDFPLEHPLVISTNNTIDQSFYKNVFRWKTVLEKIKDPNHIKAFIHARLRPIFNR